MVRQRLLGLLGVLVVVATGCSVTSDPAVHYPRPTDARDGPLGDVRTVDTCSLVDTDAFDDLAPSARASVDGRGFGKCSLQVDLRDPSQHDRYSEEGRSLGSFLLPVESDEAKTTLQDYEARFDKSTFSKSTVKGYRVYKGKAPTSSDPDEISCVRGITVGERSITIQAVPEGAGSVTSCDVADAALASTIAVLQRGTVRHTHWPKGSPAGLDLCQALDSTTKRVVGADAKPYDEQYSVFTCGWQTPSKDGASVSVAARAWPPVAEASAAGRRMGFRKTTLAGDPAFCMIDPRTADSEGSRGRCSVKYGPSPFEGKVTILRISASLQAKPKVRTRLREYSSAVVKALETEH